MVQINNQILEDIGLMKKMLPGMTVINPVIKQTVNQSKPLQSQILMDLFTLCCFWKNQKYRLYAN
jgi:hypothetical protein